MLLEREFVPETLQQLGYPVPRVKVQTQSLDVMSSGPVAMGLLQFSPRVASWDVDSSRVQVWIMMTNASVDSADDLFGSATSALWFQTAGAKPVKHSFGLTLDRVCWPQVTAPRRVLALAERAG